MWHAAGVSRPWNDPVRDIAFARRGPHSTVLVAELGGRIVATAMVGEDGHRGWVHYVAADPAHQCEGLGRAMMDAAEKWLAVRGFGRCRSSSGQTTPPSGSSMSTSAIATPARSAFRNRAALREGAHDHSATQRRSTLAAAGSRRLSRTDQARLVPCGRADRAYRS